MEDRDDSRGSASRAGSRQHPRRRTPPEHEPSPRTRPARRPHPSSSSRPPRSICTRPTPSRCSLTATSRRSGREVRSTTPNPWLHVRRRLRSPRPGRSHPRARVLRRGRSGRRHRWRLAGALHAAARRDVDSGRVAGARAQPEGARWRSGTNPCSRSGRSIRVRPGSERRASFSAPATARTSATRERTTSASSSAGWGAPRTPATPGSRARPTALRAPERSAAAVSAASRTASATCASARWTRRRDSSIATRRTARTGVRGILTGAPTGSSARAAGSAELPGRGVRRELDVRPGDEPRR